MTTVERIQEDLKTALKSREKTAVSALRLLLASIKNESIAKRSELEEADVLRVIQREVKRRNEAIEGFQAGGSEERAAQEKAERGVLERYLPQQMEPGEIDATVQAIIKETGAADASAFGPVMKRAMQSLQGRADGRTVQATVKRLLTGGGQGGE